MTVAILWMSMRKVLSQTYRQTRAEYNVSCFMFSYIKHLCRGDVIVWRRVWSMETLSALLALCERTDDRGNRFTKKPKYGALIFSLFSAWTSCRQLTDSWLIWDAMALTVTISNAGTIIKYMFYMEVDFYNLLNRDGSYTMMNLTWLATQGILEKWRIHVWL